MTLPLLTLSGGPYRRRHLLAGGQRRRAGRAISLPIAPRRVVSRATDVVTCSLGEALAEEDVANAHGNVVVDAVEARPTCTIDRFNPPFQPLYVSTLVASGRGEHRRGERDGGELHAEPSGFEVARRRVLTPEERLARLEALVSTRLGDVGAALLKEVGK